MKNTEDLNSPCEALMRYVCALMIRQQKTFIKEYMREELEALRERRPPWPRQIITLILPTVKMLSPGCERLYPPLKKKKKKKKKKRFWNITCMTIWVCYHYYGVFCSFTHLTIPRSPPKFNQFFLVLLRTHP